MPITLTEQSFHDFQVSFLFIKNGELPLERKYALLLEIIDDLFRTNDIDLDLEETLERWYGIVGNEG